MTPEDAEEFSLSLAQIGAGWWRQIAWAFRQEIPEALGMSRREWAEKYHGHMRMPIEDRRQAVAELAPDMSNVAIADALGVVESTVREDKRKLAQGSRNRESEQVDRTSVEIAPSRNRDLEQIDLEEAIEAKAPNHAEQVRLARIAKEFAVALHAVSSLPLLEPEDVWAACTRVEIESAEGTLQSAIRWLKNVQRRGIHVV